MNHELDLIPATYRERIKIQRWLNYFAVLLAVILIIAIGLKIQIHQQLKSLKSDILTLQKDKQVNIRQQQTFTDLQKQEKSLSAKFKILDGLRGGPPVRHIFLAIDRIINGDIWFTHWRFTRTNKVTDVKPETVKNGYFIIIPEELSKTSKPQTWEIQTYMEITGQALNHSLLAKFVSDLIKQPEVTDVKLIDTNLSSYNQMQVVDFKMIVFVNNQYEI